ncbi:hydroxyneurosporene-O-methyltransferase [Nocardia tenerifensis]|uniref:Hydroxyneurosporene-O-methyltransferase n=1 Tax=Nocardia tenerifensis TaxID=228006 RepID=A0A318JVZ3_9NOCA|nr:acetylserotonin O-methyltransferase [Nocardia tenerifensis]PXX60190.1 hydroxyneurosporene-O-methyltransferase [Nocardia tenerifensis]
MASDHPRMPPPGLVRVVELLRNGLAIAYRRLVPGQLAVMELLAAGWLTQAIHAAAELGVADALADGPRSGAELARTVGADEDALHRLLRLLIGHGIFTRRRDGRYALTPMARTLRRDEAVSLRDAALFFGSSIHRDNWSHLVDAVRTGRPVGEALHGMSFFEHTRADRALGTLFDNAMTSIGGLGLAPLLAAYDFARYETLVDVGGGEGTLLAEILCRAPRSKAVLFELPEVAESAADRLAELGLADRCAIEHGSFFAAVPRGGDAYILKHILHDWPEDEAGRILTAVRAAMKPDARLLIIELVVPEHARPHPGKFIDLEMLVHTGGRERTAAEYRKFLARFGFELLRVIPTVSPDNILEAAPV